MTTGNLEVNETNFENDLENEETKTKVRRTSRYNNIFDKTLVI